MSTNKNRVFPVDNAGSLDNGLRKWLQNPQKILAPYIKEGMVALDIGCGPGFFTIEMAKMVGSIGRIIAADMQEGMLQKVRDKVNGSEIGNRINTVNVCDGYINLSGMVNFILAAYMVHEVPDKITFFKQMHKILDLNGIFLIMEPSFHVSKIDFESTLKITGDIGFKISAGPRVIFSRTAILKK